MKKKKTIIFVQNIEYPQQGAVDIFYYSKYLSKDKNYNIKVIVNKINDDISNENLEIIELGKISGFTFLKQAFNKIKEINKKQKIDYVYFFAQNPFSVLLQFLVKIRLEIDTIYDVISGPIGNGIIHFISKNTIKTGVRLSKKYVVLDKGLTDKLFLQKEKKHQIIPMGYDEEVFKQKQGVNLFNKKDGEIIFTYIGTLNKERNLDIFIKAFKENLNKYKNIKLYFIGYGNGEENLKEVSGKYLDKNIFFLGKKEHKKISDYINSSDIMISYVPKIDYFEYQPPTKLIEYLACNKPVIVTNTIAQEEIMDGFEDLICRDDFESVKNKINYFIKNFEGLRYRKYFLLIEDYSWEKLVGKLKNIVNV